MIAVDMLMHSFRRNMDRAMLLTADLDFKPLIDALVSNGTYVTLWYPPKRTNKELIASADERRQLDVGSIYDAIKLGSRSFLLPQATGEPHRGEIGKLLNNWSVDGEDFTLWQTDTCYTIRGPNANPGYNTYYSHPDLNVLRLYAEDVILAPIPPEAG
jgi:NYN domain